MIPKNPKVGEVYRAFNTTYEVVSVGNDGSFVSRINNDLVITENAYPIVEETKAEPVKVEPVKVVVKKPATKKPTVKKK